MESVYEKKEKCCGCGLCSAICSVQAIKMQEDEMGYIYPVIDKEKCINCGKCKSMCAFQLKKAFTLPLETYAATRCDQDKLLNSSSGGVFAAIAEMFIMQGDYVCGARIEDDFSVKHVLISTEQELSELLGSKYVQSDILDVLERIRDVLHSKKVLFCGTPCQVQAVKAYTCNSSNLYTVELICHGVPSVEMFKSYVCYVGKGKALKYTFRDKKQGWSYNGLLTTNDGRTKKINHRLSSYMTFFMRGELCRESCFSCPFAKPQRGADITIGDFWGIVRKCPQVSKNYDIDKGVSCLLVNNNRGEKLLENIELNICHVEYADIREGNAPLNKPTCYPKNRDEVLELWNNDKSWKELEKYWKKRYFRISYWIWSIFPNNIRQFVRLLLKKR